MASYSVLLLVVAPALGIVQALLFLVLPFAWFFPVNRLLFGTGLAPKV
jgi:hypothetical protein